MSLFVDTSVWYAAEDSSDSSNARAKAILSVGAADLEAAWQMGIFWRDQDFSIVDRTSFAVMCRLGIERAASFDADFAVETPVPG